MIGQVIVGFHQDQEGHWAAELGCGHAQHVRHLPPWQNRSWVLCKPSRDEKLGHVLECAKCDRAEPIDGDWVVKSP